MGGVVGKSGQRGSAGKALWAYGGGRERWAGREATHEGEVTGSFIIQTRTLKNERRLWAANNY